MGRNWDRQIASINRMLDKNGGIIFVEEKDTTMHKSFGVFSQIVKTYESGSLTTNVYREFYMSTDIADDYVPTIGDYLLSGTNVSSIVEVDPFQPDPDGPVVFYRLVVKV